jgi:hypothetical protein
LGYYGNKKERGERKSNLIGDFIPTKDSFGGKLENSGKLFIGSDIFNIPENSVPSREQMGQIWFTFNLVRNFIQNKNLKPDGIPEKFINWARVLEERYPSHPYINFSLYLANSLIENKKEAENQYIKTLENLKDEYWKEKFDQFKLTELSKKFPLTAKGSGNILEFLRREYER